VGSFLPLFAEFNVRLPETPFGWIVLLGGFGLAMVLAVVVYIYDAKKLHPLWTTWLLFLRLAVFAALLVIAMNPQDRTSSALFTPSRVVLLVDTSTSMGFREKSGGALADPSTPVSKRSRSQAVVELMKKTPLVKELTKYHEVSVYTFDRTISKQPRRFFASALGSSGRDDKAKSQDGKPGDKPETKTKPPEWDEVFKPQGRETRLGDMLRELMRTQKGKTLSAIVVVSDGQWNSGMNPVAAHQYALQNKVRLITVGVGPLTRPINVRVADVKGPTDVNKGDPYDIKAYVQGDGTEGREVNVSLWVRPDNPDDKNAQFKRVEDAGAPDSITLGKDGVSKEIVFNVKPKEKGKFQYKVEVQPNFAVDEFDKSDNVAEHRVNVMDRNLGVLIIAGGPMRDFRFARNMLYRHKNIDVDIWLQTVDPKYIAHISQDADDILTQFPEEFPTRPIAKRDDYVSKPENKNAIKYDVIIAFDPDWMSDGFPSDAYKRISDWVSADAGGLIVVAGDVNTPRLASAPELKPIRALYPVVLSNLIALDTETKSDKPRRIVPTEKGRGIPFLKLGLDDIESDRVWSEFEGLYRCYPTTGKKAGAVVYMEYDDPVLENVFNSKPILIASQYYGIGRVVYVGNAELWRLRDLDEDYFDRFWIKAVREVGQGRLGRKSPFGTVLLRKSEYYVGETVTVEAKLINSSNKPVIAASVDMEVLDPKGDPVAPKNNLPKLLPDESRPGYYVGDFPVQFKGTYRISVRNPGVQGRPAIPATVVVNISQKEALDPRQNAKVLTDLARDTGGKYFPLATFHKLFQSVETREQAVADARTGNAPPAEIKTAEKQLASVRNEIELLFPNRGYRVVIPEEPRTLWDMKWVMFLLVGLLSAEWLTRKLLKLA
jgi:hypothetical protein